jgi:hypothetical protein
MYECRWTRERDGEKVTWRNEGEGNVRRNQVVAIQDDVLEGVEKEIVDAIFARYFKGERRERRQGERFIFMFLKG